MFGSDTNTRAPLRPVQFRCIVLAPNHVRRLVPSKTARSLIDFIVAGGDLAQMVERSLSMREALGSMPRFSTFATFAHLLESTRLVNVPGTLVQVVDAPCAPY